jgi:hypothetical protein
MSGNTPSASVGSTTETVKYYYPPTNTDFRSASRAITLRRFSALSVPAITNGCPLVDPPLPTYTYGYFKQYLYSIMTTPGNQTVEAGYDGMTVTETVTTTYNNHPEIPVNEDILPTATSAESQVYDCLGIGTSIAPLPSNYLMCRTQTIKVGGILVRTQILKYTNTDVSIVGTCP